MYPANLKLDLREFVGDYGLSHPAIFSSGGLEFNPKIDLRDLIIQNQICVVMTMEP